MDDVVNRMAKELSDAIAAAVAEDTRVEAVIGFVNRTQPGALARTVQPQQKALPAQKQQRQFEISANDKRFLRSLRIAADETQEKEVE